MDNKVTSLIINIAIGIVGTIGLYLVFSAMGNTAEIDPVTMQATSDTASVSRVVNYSMWILGITLGAIAIFTVIAIVSHPKRFIPTAIGIVSFAVLVLIGYSFVNVETTGPIMELKGSTADNLLIGGLGIKTTYVLVAVAIGLIVAQGARGLFGYFSSK